MTWADAEAGTLACQLRDHNGLRGQSGWMAWIGRHDCGAESDPLGLCCRYREHRQRIWGDAALGCPGCTPCCSAPRTAAMKAVGSGRRKTKPARKPVMRLPSL